MATAKKSPKRRIGGRAPRWPKVVLALAILAAGLAWFFRDAVMERALAGTAYGARVGCSCRFVGGRGLEDCLKDFEPGMAMVRLAEDDAAKSVTASVPLLASQTATYREGYGCVLEQWER